MAYELGPQTIVSLSAAEDLSGSQYMVVYCDANGAAALNNDGGTEIPLGILQNAPTAGQTAEVVVAGVTKAMANSGFALQNLLAAVDADGMLSNVIAGDYVVGQPLTAPGGAGEIFTALVNFSQPYLG